MSHSQRNTGVVFVGPGLGSQGGIATVIANFSKTGFWAQYQCDSYASTTDLKKGVSKLFGDLSRFLKFATTTLFGRKPRVVSIHAAQDSSFYRKLAYLLVSRVAGVPAVLHIHPASFIEFCRNGGHVRRYFVSVAGRCADQIVVLSESIRQALQDVFDANKLQVLHNPVDVAAFQNAGENGKSERPHVLFLGWIIREKGVYDIVDAIPAVLEEFPDALFSFGGNKEVEKLRSLVERRDVGHATEVLGWVEGGTKADLFRSAWTLLLPSYSEGVPNVVLEAMAAGLPVVATPVGGIPDVLEDRRNGLLIEPREPHAISTALIELLSDAELRHSLANAALRDARQRYSLEAADRGLRSIYERYLDKEMH